MVIVNREIVSVSKEKREAEINKVDVDVEIKRLGRRLGKDQKDRGDC